MRKPDLLCIGAQKAGTSWLYQILRQRPDVWTPPLKELHFFDHKFTEDNRRWTHWHIDSGVERERKRLAGRPRKNLARIAVLDAIAARPRFNRQWYQRIFAHAPDDAASMDVTPEYSCVSEEGVDFIARFLPKAKFIYIIRDPLDRARSQLRMNLERQGKLPKTEDEWLSAVREPAIANRGDYQTYIPRWTKLFDGKRLLFLPFGAIASRPVEFIRDVERFVGLPAFDHANLDRVVHASQPVVFPQMVEEFLSDLCAPQSAFLDGFFDAEFLTQIR